MSFKQIEAPLAFQVRDTVTVLFETISLRIVRDGCSRAKEALIVYDT